MKFNRNFWLITFAVILTLALWIQVKLMNEQSTTVVLRVDYLNQPDDFSTDNLPSRIKFRVIGQGFDILKLKLLNTHVQYDVSSQRDKDFEFDLDNVKMDLPSSVSLLEIVPLDTDKQVINEPQNTSELPVELTFANEDARNFYNTSNFQLSTDKVNVRGKTKYLRSIKSIRTFPITREMLNKAKVKVRLQSPSKNVHLYSESVNVFKQDEEVISRIITSVPVKSNKQLQFFPKEITIRVRGQAELVKSLSIRDIEATLDLTANKDGQVPLKISLPDNIDLLDYSPTTVTLSE